MVKNKNISFSIAAPSDVYDLWAWRNDELSRKMSGNSNKISFTEHKQWLQTTDEEIFIAYSAFDKIGCVRIKTNNELSWVIAPKKRQQGYGALMLYNFCNVFLPEERFAAKIKHENMASIKIALHAGFVLTESDGAFQYFTKYPTK